MVEREEEGRRNLWWLRKDSRDSEGLEYACQHKAKGKGLQRRDLQQRDAGVVQSTVQG